MTENDQHNTARQLYDESMTKVSDETEKLETIREILFGEHSREAEKRRHDTHHSLQLSITELKQESRDQFEFISTEINKLHQLISSESQHRLADKKSTHQLIDELQSSVEKTNAKQKTENARLHQQILDESSKLEQQVAKQHKALSEKLERASLELNSDKTDRSDLAKLLQGVAEKLLDTNNK